MEKKVLLLDIDFTLFDARFYRNTFVKNIQKEIGYLKEDFTDLAEKAYQTSKVKAGYFDPGIFVDDLINLLGIDSSKKQKLEEFISDQKTINDSIYKDVVEVLVELKKKGLIMGIFSAGKKTAQRPKIKLIEDVLDQNHIHIFEFHKGYALPNLVEQYKDYKVILVDDILGILNSAKTLNPKITTVLIKRRETLKKNQEVDNFEPDYIISTLKELIPIV